MAKKGMKRIDSGNSKKTNPANQVPLIEGVAKHGKSQVRPIIAGTHVPSQKVYHSTPHSQEKPIASVYSVIDTDLARDNLENDITAADLQDM